jgi:hypothetical protein
MHPSDKKSRKNRVLEQVLVAKVCRLSRNLLQGKQNRSPKSNLAARERREVFSRTEAFRAGSNFNCGLTPRFLVF